MAGITMTADIALATTGSTAIATIGHERERTTTTYVILMA
jgi:hypothetical protein